MQHYGKKRKDHYELIILKIKHIYIKIEYIYIKKLNMFVVRVKSEYPILSLID